MSKSRLSPDEYKFSSFAEADDFWTALKGSTAGITVGFTLAVRVEEGRTLAHKQVEMKVSVIAAIPGSVNLRISGSTVIDGDDRRLEILYDQKEPLLSRCIIG